MIEARPIRTNLSASSAKVGERFMIAVTRTKLRSLWNRAIRLPLQRLVERTIFRRQIERFYLVFGGHIFFQTLRTAVQLGLFDLIELNGPLSRTKIAENLK